MNRSTNVFPSKKWSHIRCLLERPGPFQRPEFKPSNELLKLMQERIIILVVGAGGLGCELLKDLALTGFTNLSVMDMDTIDVSNLNRQFLFRAEDVGKPKAEVAAKRIMERVPSCKVVSYFNKLQEFGEDFYRQFNVVVSGLDSVVARRWINNTLASLVRYKADGSIDPFSVIPLVDGGTEGFKGHVLTVIYGLTGCIECSLDLYPPQVNYPLCTIAHTPRLPEHCIEYVRLLHWPRENPFGENVEVDGDSPEHLQWIYDQSLKRANEYGITGITMFLVKGVVKHIIPAVASTNAVVAAACAFEVFKLVTFCYDPLKSYMNFSDIDGVHTFSFLMERKPDCLACNNAPKQLRFHPESKLSDVITYLKDSDEFRMQSPSITTVQDGSNRSLFIDVPGFTDILKPNLAKTIRDLGLVNGQKLFISDATTPRTMTFELIWSSDEAAMSTN